MTPEYALDMARRAMQVTMMVGAPMLLALLAVGLLVVVFQVVTQLSEQALSFTPELLAVAATMVLIGPWVIAVIVDYTHGVLTSIPNYMS